MICILFSLKLPTFLFKIPTQKYKRVEGEMEGGGVEIKANICRDGQKNVLHGCKQREDIARNVITRLTAAS